MKPCAIPGSVRRPLSRPVAGGAVLVTGQFKMASPLFARLMGFKLPAADVEDIISSQFRHSVIEEDRIEYSHHSGFFESPIALTLLLDETNRSCDAIEGPGWRPDDLPAIEAKLSKLASSTRLTHVRRILFSDTPVRTAFRYRDEFQILPMPPGSPVPAELNAEWPFLFEFTYLGSDHSIIDARRHDLASSKLVSLLNALSLSHISPISSASDKAWVLTDTGRTAWAQIGYFHPVPNGPGFLDTSRYAPMRRFPSESFYQGFADTLHHGFSWADDIEQMLGNYSAMSETDRDRFDMAAHWYGRYPELRRVSGSAGLVALVTALEALAPKAVVPPCQTCGHVGSVIAGFRLLLDGAVPGHSEEKDQFYRLRSRIAHGSGLMFAELSGWGGGSQATSQHFAQYRIEEVVRLALHNWLDPDVRSAIDEAARGRGPAPKSS